MADFRQLALEFVLAEEEAKLNTLAQQSASELAKAPSTSNPVARWVEAVQPWMPSAGGDDEMGDSFESTNWTARAKALEYLSRTLDFLAKDLLKPSQIKLLIGFFSAMFDIDHKAGIMASSTALSRIVAMKSFQPSSGNDIIKAVCTLRDDFPRQLAKTRLAVFELLRHLISDPKVAADLRQRHGTTSEFMTDLLKLCQNERDPNCLLVWFDILRRFLSEYEPSSQVIEEVYGTFKAYFPITLPRASQSGITPEELKMALRSCFTSNYQLAPHTFPFLVGKLDQGEGVTVNVKVDILRTIQACVEEYHNPEQSIAPYFDQVWSSLKYEVRNGEIEDTIFATLEVLKTFARRLQGDKLRDYALSVTHDCVADLSNAMYTAAAGRLLVSVLSASPAAFVLMASPTITHIKENLRHPKSPSHGQDLLKLLHVVLEARLLLVDAEMTGPERSDFEAIDAIFKTLYDEVYDKPVQRALDMGSSAEDLQTATQAIQGVGALLCQRSATVEGAGDSSNQLLMPQTKCLDVSHVLFNIVTQRTPGDPSSRSEASDELVNETIKALQRTVTVIPDAFAPLVTKGIDLMKPTETGLNNVGLVHAYGPVLAFVGCSQLPTRTPGYGLKNFLILASALYRKLLLAIDTGAGIDLCSALIAGLQSTVRHFNDACKTQEMKFDEVAWDGTWLPTIGAKYPVLLDTSREDDVELAQLSLTGIPSTTAAIHSDFLLSSLAITQQLYLRSTKPVDNAGLALNDAFAASYGSAEVQYLNLLATLAGFVFHEMSEAQQLALEAQNYTLHLFSVDRVHVRGTDPEEPAAARLDKIAESRSSEWDWLAFSRVNILSLGILKALRPSVVSKLFDIGAAQDILVSSVTRSSADSSSMAVAKSIVTILSNKYKIETSEPLMRLIEARANTISQQSHDAGDTGANLDAISAIAAGMLRRNSGKPAQPLLSLLKESLQNIQAAASASKAPGAAARRLEALVTSRDILAKDNFAIVRPLWTQKAYFDVVKPLLGAASALKGPDQLDVRANLSVGLLLMVRHMPFAIYEDDAEEIVRIAISVAQRGVTGDQTVPTAASDVRAALQVLKDILIADKDQGKTHLKSIVSLCVDIFSSSPSSSAKARPDPHCVKLALEIAGGLPNMFESQHLLQYRPRLDRELALACGNPVRELRRTARLAREAWDRLK